MKANHESKVFWRIKNGNNKMYWSTWTWVFDAQEADDFLVRDEALAVCKVIASATGPFTGAYRGAKVVRVTRRSR